jgi:hypothetical protein
MRRVKVTKGETIFQGEKIKKPSGIMEEVTGWLKTQRNRKAIQREVGNSL